MPRRTIARTGFIGLVSTLAAACSPSTQPPPSDTPSTMAPTSAPDERSTETVAADDTAEADAHADVIAVEASGSDGAYTFTVTVRSPDTGCDRYADWWEVVSTDGALLYRRILAHSHVDEQPFSRSGGPVAIDAQTSVIVRAHLGPTARGYGGAALEGSVAEGFVPATARPPEFAAALETTPPLPDDCAF